jgi:hypothetical protein
MPLQPEFVAVICGVLQNKEMNFLKKTRFFCLFLAGIILSATLAVRGHTPRSGAPQNSNGKTTKAPVDPPKSKTDLTGAYSGNVKITGAFEMSGEGDITITGNFVTIVADGSSQTGRIFAVAKKGYIGVRIHLTHVRDPATGTELILMARATRKGSSLILTPEPKAANTISFK